MGIVATLALSPVAISRTDSAQDRKPCGHEYQTHRHGIADAKHTDNLERLRHFAQCARTPAKERWIRKRIEDIEDARVQKASVTPYPGPNGTWWAIPWYIVDCESHGDWGAYNSSGARGPYQFVGWDVPWPVDSEADKLAHHRMAAKLWAGGAGASHWVCA